MFWVNADASVNSVVIHKAACNSLRILIGGYPEGTDALGPFSLSGWLGPCKTSRQAGIAALARRMTTYACPLCKP